MIEEMNSVRKVINLIMKESEDLESTISFWTISFWTISV